jgi:glycosyltransferase involved in cell wall biosynthesis
MTAVKSQSMARAGLDVTIFGFPVSFDDIIPSERLRYISIQDGLSNACRKFLCRLSRSLGRVWLFIFEVGWVQWAALRYARRHDMDILYVSDVQPWLMLLTMWFSGSRNNKPRIAVWYSSLFHETSAKSRARHVPWYTMLQYRLNAWSALRLPIILDVIGDCQYMVEPYSKISPERVHAIMGGYFRSFPSELEKSQARRDLGIPPGAKVLLHFGQASPGKGVIFLFEALQYLPTDFELYVVGSTIAYSYENIMHLIPPEWRDHVHFVSRHVSEKERIAYFTACDAVAVPYTIGFFSAAGNFQDAISFGKPVIVSDQYLMGDMVRKYNIGILFKPEDATDLRRALLEFSKKPNDWFQGITECCEAVVEEYSWDNIGLRHRALFETMAAAGTQQTRTVHVDQDR